MIAYTDRSRLLTFQDCPRRRYLTYHLLGTGIQRIRGTVPLMTGAYVHAGLADTLQQSIALEHEHHEFAFRYVDVERSVRVAVDGYRRELAARGLDLELGEDAQAVADEQVALTEGLVRAYVRAPNGLEALLRTYRVVEVEQEDTWKEFTRTSDGTEIVFQARADGLLQERASGDLYVLSFKTAATQDWRKDSEGRHDVQGLSEVVTIERRLRATEPDARIMGVQMVYLLKGVRRQAYDGGPYTTSSPLLRGWYRDGVTEREYAWKEETPCPGPGHVVGYTKKGPTLCEGKKFHKLGQGWTKFDVGRAGNELTVGEWTEMLASGTVQPEAGSALDSVVWVPQPYYRQDRDAASWVRQAQAQEREVVGRAALCEQVRQDDPKSLLELLDTQFVQYRSACDWPSPCQFVPVCWGDETALTNPLATQLYQRRVPHHRAELDALVRIAPAVTNGDNGDNVQQAVTED
jgi:PD-(D/E)XK nuclease superfamily